MASDWNDIGIWLGRSALGGSLLLLLGLLFMRLVRQPARRQRLGELSVLAALAVAIANLAPAWVTLPWPGEPEPQITYVHVDSAPLTDVPVEMETGVWGEDLVDDNLPEVSGVSISPAGAEAAEATMQEPHGLATPLPWIIGIYALGAAWVLSRLGIAYLGLWRIVRCCRPPHWRLQQLFDRCLGKSIVRPRLLVSSRLRAPISFGIWRPTVVLPECLAQPEEGNRLRWTIAHELTHLERRDALSALLMMLGQAVFFYLPWFWWVRRQVRLCQEYVADAAAATGNPADAYAEFLLSWTAAPALPVGAAGVSGHTSDLYRRVTMLLNQRSPVETRCPRWWLVAVAASLFGLALCLGGVGLAAQEPTRVIVIRTPAGGDAAPKVEAPKVRIEKKDGRDIIIIELDRGDDAKKPAPKVEVKPKRIVIPKDGGEFEIELFVPDGKFELPKDIRILIEKKLHDLGADKGIDLPKDIRIELEKFVPGLPGLPAKGGKIEWKWDGPAGDFWRLSAAAPADMDRLRKLLEKMRAGGKVDPTEVQKELADILEGKKGKATRALPYIAAGPLSQRLGLKLAKPSEILAEQLNLTKGSGLVITEVKADSAAAKAGLKTNDLILKIGGKSVSDDPNAFGAGVDAKDDLDVVVLRKGKETTIKGLKAPAGAATPATARFWLGGRDMVFPNPVGGAVTTTHRTDDRITTRHQEGTLTITITAKAADGKATVEEIAIQDGAERNRYDSVDKVPAAQRERVRSLIALTMSSVKERE